MEKPNVRFHDGQILSEEPLNKAMEAVDASVDAANASQASTATAEAAAISAQEAAVAAQTAATTTQGYVQEIKKAMQNLPDGSAVSSQVAINKADISQLDLKSKNNLYNLEFTGNGSNFVSKKLELAKNRKYAIIPINPDWNKNGCYPGYSGSILEGWAITENGNKKYIPVSYIYSATKYDDIKDCYIFETNIEGALEYRLGIRAAVGEIVKFNLVDVTLSVQFNEEYIGSSETFNGHNTSGWSNVKTKFTLKKGIEYIIYVEFNNLKSSGTNPSWDIIQLCGAGGLPTLLEVNSEYAGKYNYKEIKHTPNNDLDLYLYDKLSSDSEVKLTVIQTTPLYHYLQKTSINDVVSRNREQIERIKSMGVIPSDVRLNSIPNLVFAHISDTHAPNGTADQIPNAIKVVNTLYSEGGNVKFLLHTGDVRYDIYTDDYSYFANSVKVAKLPVFVVPGNHDCGWKTVSESGTDEQIYHQMIEPMLSSWNLSTSHNGNPHVDGKNYYFKDFDDEHIRMICLYEFETDFAVKEDGVTLVNMRSIRSFRQAQIDWFVNSLLTTPDGYGIIVVKHQPEDYVGDTDSPFNSIYGRDVKYGRSYINGELIAEVVDAFISRQQINKTWSQDHHMQNTLTVSADFSSAKGEFVAYISGHIHRDHTSFLKNYPNQLELNIGANNTGYNTGQDIKMIVGEKSQDIINVYSIDLNNGVIQIARIGGDYSGTGQVRQFDTIKFRNS